MNHKEFVVISDSLGDTAQQMLKAALSQFHEERPHFKVYASITTVIEVDNIFDQIQHDDCYVLSTVVLYDLQEYIEKKCHDLGIVYFDAMSPLLFSLASFLQREPKYEPGAMHRLDVSYFNRVEAIEFAVKYDDGKNIDGIHKADIVLLGISRTSKTPLSMYLANLSYKVCNVPIVLDLEPPQEIYEIDPKKIIGLTNDADVLLNIRRNRMKSMGLASASSYSTMERIQEEIAYAHGIYRRLGCRVINVANTSIEENASLILRSFKQKN